MFSSKERLQKRTPKDGIGREDYIQLLVDEFYETINSEAKEQVTANLANFAYDPLNYGFLRNAKAVDLFLELLDNPSNRLTLHGIAGICNLCTEPEFRHYIISLNGISRITTLLTNTNLDIVANCLTTLLLLMPDESAERELTCTTELKQTLTGLAVSESLRIKNLVALFLGDYFQQVEQI